MEEEKGSFGGGFVLGFVLGIIGMIICIAINKPKTIPITREPNTSINGNAQIEKNVISPPVTITFEIAIDIAKTINPTASSKATTGNKISTRAFT